jgi:hypothetical protein
VRALSVGLLVEEQRSEIAAAWKRAAETELGGEPALAFAVGPLLREMALALRGEDLLPRARSLDGTQAPAGAGGAVGAHGSNGAKGTGSGHGEGGEPPALRSAVLVRSGAAPARVAREFKLLHRALWETLRAAGRVVGADERRAADEWLDDALAAMLERIDRVRTRSELLDRSADHPAHARPDAAERGSLLARPPPLPRFRTGAARPPPLPSAPIGVE